MEKQVLFISDKRSMVADALIKILEGEAFRVRTVRASVTDIARMAEEDASYPALWILFLQGDDSRMTGVLSYISEQIRERGVLFYVIGNAEEVEENLKGFPPAEIRSTFIRPFRSGEVVDRLTADALRLQRKNESKRILVVDDDPTMLRTMKDMLSGRYRVYVANSGLNAIQMLVKTEVDLILLDYEMPVVKGYQVLEMLRGEAHTKGIPVMFLTSKNDKESIMRVMELKPVNYLLKSCPKSEILGKIEEFFDREE